MSNPTQSSEKQAEVGQPQPAMDSPKRRGRAPLLLEAVYVASVGALLSAGLGTASLSLLAGVEVWLAAARAGLAVVMLGGVLWIVNYRLMHGALEAAVQEASEKKATQHSAAPDRASLGMEWKA